MLGVLSNSTWSRPSCAGHGRHGCGTYAPAGHGPCLFSACCPCRSPQLPIGAGHAPPVHKRVDPFVRPARHPEQHRELLKQRARAKDTSEVSANSQRVSSITSRRASSRRTAANYGTAASVSSSRAPGTARAGATGVLTAPAAVRSGRGSDVRILAASMAFRFQGVRATRRTRTANRSASRPTYGRRTTGSASSRHGGTRGGNSVLVAPGRTREHEAEAMPSVERADARLSADGASVPFPLLPGLGATGLAVMQVPAGGGRHRRPRTGPRTGASAVPRGRQGTGRQWRRQAGSRTRTPSRQA